MAQKQLVITSDDLGMSSSVNGGIDLAARRGALTSTNIMVPCPWFEHAAANFRHDSVDLGVHLTLTCDWRYYTWRPVTSSRSLVDEQGRMYSTIANLMRHATAEDIRQECRRQIDLAVMRGLPIAYVDVHMCIPSIDFALGENARAMNPEYERALMRIVQDVADEFGLPYPYALEGDRLRYFRSALSISGKGRAAIERYLAELQPGVHHLSCHCALSGDEQASLTSPDDPAFPWALQYRQEDLACISSGWFASLRRVHDIELIRMPFLAPRSDTHIVERSH